MTLLQKLSLAATLSSATFSVAASIPQAIQKTIQPDNVVVCEPNAGCVNKTLFGRSYKVITTPRFTVMVSVSNEGVYTRADVSITNHTDTSLSMTPEDFRVEVVTPKPKVLLYVSPANVTLPPPPVARAARGPQTPTPTHQAFVTPTPQETPNPPATAETESTPASQSTDVEALYAVAEQNAARQEAAEKAAAEKPLSAASIAPNEVTRGRVYFERDKKSHLVNVVLPIAGLVFEFPYAMKH
ncbi:MAG TPA: hypothetical protein VH117_08615, partial [Edaphobacter sp.]|jgi:hypothetical protein|nr:hypothetical protein [Edaphobacter sp.]